jgi:ankyrin repeat protein
MGCESYLRIKITLIMDEMNMSKNKKKNTAEMEFMKGYSPLLVSIAHHKYYAMVAMLENGLADIKSTDKAGNTVLHVLVRHSKGQDECKAIPYLIGKGADLNAVNAKGQTPLQIAEAKGYKDLVVALTSAKKSSSSSVGIFARKPSESPVERKQVLEERNICSKP